MNSQDVPPHWEALVRSSTELATDEDYSLVDTWYKSSMIKKDSQEEESVLLQGFESEKKRVTFESNIVEE